MRIAAFNVENLFDRAKALNEDTAEATAVINAVAELNTLFEKDIYSDADKARMLELMEQLGILRRDEGPYVWLRRSRGKLVHRPQDEARPVTIEAGGRGDWVGWIEHKKMHVNETAVMNTGRVIRDVNADILAVIEADNRKALINFTDYVLNQVREEIPEPPTGYRQVMLIDGNDDRGIDVGLMTKTGFEIGLMRSHVDEMFGKDRLFSRDCPEFAVMTPGGNTIWVLPNHLKSKFGGDTGPVRDRRKAQAARVRKIYDDLLAAGHENVVILGDLNDTPDSEALAEILGNGGPRDVSDHASFDTGEFPGRGTFGLGNDRDKIDYLLLSPALFARITGCGLFRKGAWPGTRPKRWTVYPELVRDIHVASDHHVIWADLDLD